MNGVINFFKPRGITSHDAVYFFRKLLGIKRIGHTGTLDPNVTGVLPICIGRATRVSQYVMEDDKEYIGEVTFGIETDTQDIDGRVLNSLDKEISKKQINETFRKFQGKISQTPPMYSALRHKGKRLYELARDDIVVDRKPRNINISKLEIINNQDNKKVIFYTQCSKGTYIRTLCHDIGKSLGTYGYMSYLIRTGVGDFKIKDSFSQDYLTSLSKTEIEEKVLLPMDRALGKLCKIKISSRNYRLITNGVMVEVDKSLNYSLKEELRVYCRGEFIGIGRIIEKGSKHYIKMDKVLV